MEASMLPDSPATLLIVDDEPLMTDLFRQSMTKRGFQVCTASSGAEALEIVDEGRPPIDLVITDVSMPGMNGFEIAKALAQRPPGLPVLLATGHDSELTLAAAPPNVVGIAQKPYQAKALAERIHAILASRSTP